MASAPSLVLKGQPGSSQSGGARPKETILIRDGVFVDADAFAQNEKRSAMMASATSLASSVCSSTAEKKKRKRARGKRRKTKPEKARHHPNILKSLSRILSTCTRARILYDSKGERNRPRP
nr:hypothetical protein BaRGS_023107 [Batillaria attramentaria]